jgi:hypothetical protein
MKIRKTEIVVKYHNFYPNYNLPNNKGGYCKWIEIFDTMKEAREFKENLDNTMRVSSIYRRKIKMDSTECDECVLT